MKKALLLFLICTLCNSIMANNKYVSCLTGNDANNGTKASPYKTITKALSMAIANDSVIVSPGLYNFINNNEHFPINMKSGVKLVSTKGAYYTIISASGTDTNVMTISNTNSNTLIKGFSFIDGRIVGDVNQFLNVAKGGGVQFLNFDSSTFECNIVAQNVAIGYQGALTGTNTVGGDAEAGGIFIDNPCESIVRNCIISNNHTNGGPGRGYGGGFSGNPTNGGKAKGGGVLANDGYLYHNMIYNNTASGGPGGVTNSSNAPNLGNGGEARGGGFYAYSSSAVVENNIIMANKAIGGIRGSFSVDGSGDYGAAYTFAGFDNNLFYQNTASTSNNTGFVGTNAYEGLDPYIINPINFHVQSNSNAIAHGKLNTSVQFDFDGALRSTTSPTIGPYEMLAFTPTSFFEKDSLDFGNNFFGNTHVSIDLSISPSNKSEYVRVHYFNTGRSGKIDNKFSSDFYWSVSFSSDSISGMLIFDYSSLDLKLDTGSIKLYQRAGQNTAWEEAVNATRVGKKISTKIEGFAEFALGSGDTTANVGMNTFQNKDNNMVILPNPNNGNFSIRYSSDINSKLYIRDELGKVVRQYSIDANNDLIENIELPKGFYFIKIDSNGNQAVKKIVVF